MCFTSIASLIHFFLVQFHFLFLNLFNFVYKFQHHSLALKRVYGVIECGNVQPHCHIYTFIRIFRWFDELKEWPWKWMNSDSLIYDHTLAFAHETSANYFMTAAQFYYFFIFLHSNFIRTCMRIFVASIEI